jgi:CubicO group peptidase (beta-lactamase class C family)
MYFSVPHALKFVLVCLTSTVLADFLGPSYVPPVDLTSNHSLVALAWEGLVANLTDILHDDQTRPSEHITPAQFQNITFSLGFFSLHDHAAAGSLQFHYTSPEVATAANGTHKVNGDSIYRIASVTKLFTVLTGLLELSTTDWERPLSDILAPLGDYVSSSGKPDVYTTPWNQVTLRALAAQIAGVPRDGFPNAGEIMLQAALGGVSEADVMAASGLPPYNASDPLESPPCLQYLGKGENCPPTSYLQGVSNRAPAFLPWSTPGYSNNGFTLLGMAIANITGKTMEQLYHDDIFEPLGMASSHASAPPLSEWHRSLIVGDPAAGFAVENGIFVSSGGLFSTIRDMARFGIGILNSTLLPADQTRRWLKPVSHTAHLQYSVGAPWEIVRYTHASGAVTDMYTKLGDSGYYSAYMILLPDYGAGFSFMAASTLSQRAEVMAAIVDMMVDKMVPSLAAQAAVEAANKFAGVYTAPAAMKLNSSLVLSVNLSETAAPGLVISSWISNGTDVLPWLAKIAGPGPFRLVPSISGIADGATGTPTQIALRMVGDVDVISPAMPTGLFSGPSLLTGDWLNVDASTYYGVGLSLFVMDMGCNGKAKSISPAAYRIKLARST